jgi:2-polyprenyl-3-methyl-5-hydroxy-6-metoxy-1,4-benzoquinol methylase
MNCFRTEREKVDVNKIIFRAPPLDGDRVEKIKASIKKHGWNPDFGDLPYHGDNCQYPQPYILSRGNKEDFNELRPINGICRTTALQELGIKTADAFVHTRLHYVPKYTKKEVANKVEEVRCELQQNQRGMFQSFEFDYGIPLKSRDNSQEIFYSTEWDRFYYTNKRVLDIACNGGYFAFEAKKNGAREVIGFDNASYMIEKASIFRDLLNLDVNLSVQDFWKFDWSQKFDIVFCNQCIYHFANSNLTYAPRGSEEIPHALDLICGATTNNLVMFTFVDFKNPDFKDFSQVGYKPGYKTLINDLHKRGFKEVRIYYQRGAKYTVVASKQPWKYLHLRKPKHLILTSSLLTTDDKILLKWWELDKGQLKTLWNGKLSDLRLCEETE